MKLQMDTIKTIKLNQIQLSPNNPRLLNGAETQKEIIDTLFEKENVWQLLKDIAQHGLNPMENFGLQQIDNNKYLVFEGNRRICALKCMQKPDLAPNSYINRIKKIKVLKPITSVRASIVESEDDRILWMERMHNGTMNGAGRKPWDSRQSSNFGNKKKNELALQIIQYCVDIGLATHQEMDSKISTIQRFFSTPEVRASFGISSNKELISSFDDESFRTLMADYVELLRLGRSKEKALSRLNVNDRKEIASELLQNNSDKIKVVPQRSLLKKEADAINDQAKDISPSPPINKTSPTSKQVSHKYPATTGGEFLKISDTLDEAARKAKHYKLSALLFSITNLEVEKHTILILIAIGVILENLMRLINPSHTSGFHRGLNQNLTGFETSRKKTIEGVLTATYNIYNSTKHDTEYTFPAQLAHDTLKTLDPLLTILFNKISSKD